MSLNTAPLTARVCEEAPVSLVVNGQKLVTFMCTPQNLEELALGYLYTRGLVRSLDEIVTLAVCDEMRQIYVIIEGQLTEAQYSLETVLASGCGSGVIFSEGFSKVEKNDSPLKVPLEKLRDYARRMAAETVLYKETGGVHCAAIADGFSFIALREDVGRHNAIDKIIGKGLSLGQDFSQCVVMTTGRIASDMVLKAVAAGIPIVVSRSIPTSLALEIAEKAGITLVGRIYSKTPTVYSNSQRVIETAE